MPSSPLHLPSTPITRAIIAAWIFLSTMLLARIGYSYQALRRLKRTAFEPDDALCDRYARLVIRARVNRSVSLLVSREITSPLALGFLGPAIVLPQSFADESSSEDFDHITLHELAHLSRYDDWTNLLQQIIIALFPIQPVLSWIGRELNREREAACDDRVIATVNSAKPYAASLTRIAELALWSRSGALSNIALASGVAASRSQLYRRIHRLLDRRSNKRPRASLLALAASLAFVSCLVSLTFAAPQLIALNDPASSAAQPPSPGDASNSTTKVPDMTPTPLPPTAGTQIRSIPAEPGEKLTLDIDQGNVEVTSADKNEVRFKITQTGPNIEQFLHHHQILIGRNDRTISLQASGDDSTPGTGVDIHYEITVPKKFDLQLKNQAGNAKLSKLDGTVAAEIHAGNINASDCAGVFNAEGQAGNIRLQAMNAPSSADTNDGNIQAIDCSGPLALTSHNGNIELAEVTANVKAETTNGNVLSTAVTGALNATTNAGNIEIRKYAGPSANAHTAMGNVLADVDAAPKSDSSFTTGAGNVEVKLIGTAAVHLTIGTPLGNVDSQFPRGNVNGGGPDLRIESKAGNVAIHKK